MLRCGRPSNTQLYSAWEGFLLMEEAGVPDGVINFYQEMVLMLVILLLPILRCLVCTSLVLQVHFSICGSDGENVKH